MARGEYHFAGRDQRFINAFGSGAGGICHFQFREFGGKSNFGRHNLKGSGFGVQFSLLDVT